MKTISKILSVVLVLTMVLSFAVFASADGGEKMAIIATEGTLSEDKETITWTSTNYTFVVNKSTNTNGIKTDNYDHFRVYKGMYATVAALGDKLISKIMITATYSSYVDELEKAAPANATVSTNDLVVTFSFATPVASAQLGTDGGQWRLTSIEVVFAEGGSVTPPTQEPTTEPTTEPSTEATTPSTEPVTPPSTGLTVIETPVVGTAYKFGMIQQNVSTTDVYYLKGGMDGYYMATSNNVADAIDVYLEATTGGYYLYTLEGTTKTYINMVVSGTHVNGAYEATASTVYTYDATAKTLIAVVNDKDYWFGTRNDKNFTTVGPCATSYNGFYCQFYGTVSEPVDPSEPSTEATTPSTEATTPVAPAPTGDASVIVSSVAVLVLSAIGGTALIIKKKEN